MKKFVLFVFLLTSLFFGAFRAAQFLDQRRKALNNKNGLSFSAAKHTLLNRPFTILIIGYNNGAGVQKTLESVFSQNYDPFRLVYIDDASDDGSFEVARDAIYQSKYLTRVTLVQNEKHLGFLANLVRAAEACSDEEVLLVLKGEDLLAHEWVLERLNAYYDNPNLWLAIGKGVDVHTYEPIEAFELGSRHLIDRSLAKQGLKTFYAKLFKQIRSSDLVYSDRFLPACEDLAYLTPMLELAQEHTAWINEVCYLSQREEGKEDPEQIASSESFIRSLEPYAPIRNLWEAVCGD